MTVARFSSYLAMLGRDGLAPFGEVDQRVVAEEVGCFFLEQLEDGDRQAADLDVGRGVAAHLDEVPEARALAVTKILVSVALGKTLRAASRAFLRRRVLSGMFSECLREPVGEVAIGSLAGLDGLEPEPVQLGVGGNDLGLDERAFRLIDEPLAQLRKTKARPMPHQLVRQAAAHPGEEQVEDGVLEHRAVADLEDMADIGLVAPRPRLLKRHVADAPGGLDQFFAADLGVGRPLADVMVRQESSQRLLVDDLASEQIDLGLWMISSAGSDSTSAIHDPFGQNFEESRRRAPILAFCTEEEHRAEPARSRCGAIGICRSAPSSA